MPEQQAEAPREELPNDAFWCVIPTYENAPTLRDVAARCREQLDHVLVVDDGTTEADVAALLEGLDVEIVRHAENLGKGRAILTALQHVRARGGRYLVTVDADGQHFPEDIPLLVEDVRAHHPCLVIGSRDFSSPVIPASSRFGRSFSNMWVRLETGQALPDTQSGFRAYPVDELTALKFDGRRYDFEIEVLARTSWAGVPLRSVDIRVWYPEEGVERRSSFRPFLDNLRLSLMHTKLVGRQLVPWPHPRLVARPGGARVVPGPRAWLREQLKLYATPWGLAASAAVGMFLGVLPLIACHMLVIVYVTSRLRLNKVMALAIQNLCAPPFVPLACIELGHFALNGRWLVEVSFDTIVLELHDRLLEWLVGSLFLAPVLAVIAGVVTYALARLSMRVRRA